MGEKQIFQELWGKKWSNVYNWNTRGKNEKTNGQKKQLKRKTKKILKLIEDSKTQIREAQRKHEWFPSVHTHSWCLSCVLFSSSYEDMGLMATGPTLTASF